MQKTRKITADGGPFDIPVTELRGVGPGKAAALRQSGIVTVADLYGYFPRRYLDRRTVKSVASLRDGEQVTVVGSVDTVLREKGGRGRSRFKVRLSDGSGILELVWFRGASYLSGSFRPGDTVAVHGKVGFFGRLPQMQHPEYERLDGGTSGDLDLFHTGAIVPLYPSSRHLKKATISSRSMRRLVRNAMQAFPPLFPENLPEELAGRCGLLPLGQAYRTIHFPESPEMLEKALLRFKWTELFYAQLYFALRRVSVRDRKDAVRFNRSGRHTAALYRTLPFCMTEAQKNAVREIYRDLRSGSRMNRLLQGDVGSGKTLVAMFAMALAADNGLQAAFMAPTEILAFQHYLSIRRFTERLGLKTGILTGRQQKKERRETLTSLEEGGLDIVVGTHAMIEEGVRFRKLGLAVIDEQHRFGVLQRKALQEKSHRPHVLLMTATPIPRTLTMGVFGDLDVTVIDGMPGGRKPVVTGLRHESERAEVLEFIREEVGKGRQAYIVYPLVEESEKMDIRAATESFAQLRGELSPEIRMELIHGQMPSAEKERVMNAFRSREVDLLVGTTVIEVGVDVANATVMVVEHAERFGLSQLHQLRGRVGRGDCQSYCFLVYGGAPGNQARERLRAMERTNDGFRLSEIDASMRGAGNVLGTEQSGTVSGLKVADIERDYDIMCSARKAAFALAERDPGLREPGHCMVRDYYRRHYHDRFTLADIA
ncbi:ATP-dependent DNA helicase RecG [Prosthecochloris sp. GSB1]|uniref:ATP-dependent DNA helicase RecG n=1 Tax=Prosthecochloris sp. GSB1 TaxID=281093 RepID=UPI001EEE1409|nr:ATP-dependent DNA helicase RecG [Prosthecochloris sp. GSB1]